MTQRKNTVYRLKLQTTENYNAYTIYMFIVHIITPTTIENLPPMLCLNTLKGKLRNISKMLKETCLEDLDIGESHEGEGTVE